MQISADVCVIPEKSVNANDPGNKQFILISIIFSYLCPELQIAPDQ